MDSQIIQTIIDKIRSSNNILLVAHQKLDADLCGSVLALYHVLLKLGKKPTVLCYEKVPPILNFLPNLHIFDSHPKLLKDFIITLFNPSAEVDEVKYSVAEDGRINIIVTPKKGSFSERDISFKGSNSSYDLIITLDCGDKKNLGKVYEDNKKMFEETTVINIDHHASNDLFGDINLVDTNASSSAELVFYVIKNIDLGLIDEDIATYLLLGIIADTRSFQNDNTSSDAFNVSAELVRLGGRQQDIIKHLYKTKKLSTLKLWGKVLSKLQTDKEHRILWSNISYEDFTTTDTSEGEDTKGIIDELMSNAPNIDIICLIREVSPGKVVTSLRTKSKEVDSNEIAHQFGGGGHIMASGFTLENTSLGEVEKNLITAIRAYQAKRLGLYPVSSKPEVISQPESAPEEKIAARIKEELF